MTAKVAAIGAHYTGGKLQPVGEEEELPRPGHKGKAKVSRKERLQKKRDQKRAEREAGSDDDDINKGGPCIQMDCIAAGSAQYSVEQNIVERFMT